MRWIAVPQVIYTERRSWGSVRGTIADHETRDDPKKDDRFSWIVTLGAFRVSGSCDSLTHARRQAETAASLIAAVKGTHDPRFVVTVD